MGRARRVAHIGAGGIVAGLVREHAFEHQDFLAAGVAVTRRAPGLPVTESVEHSTPNWYKYVDVRPRMRVTTESPGHWYRNTVLPMDDPTTPTSVAPVTVAL